MSNVRERCLLCQICYSSGEGERRGCCDRASQRLKMKPKLIRWQMVGAQAGGRALLRTDYHAMKMCLHCLEKGGLDPSGF